MPPLDKLSQILNVYITKYQRTKKLEIDIYHINFINYAGIKKMYPKNAIAYLFGFIFLQNMSEQKKQWTTEGIGTLIDAFREHRNLWDPKDIHYKNRIKKMDAYKELAQLFETSSAEIERKLKNLMSQYQRERRKYKKMKKSGAGQSFRAKWFGYNAMSFIHDRNKPRKGIEIGVQYEVSSSFLFT